MIVDRTLAEFTSFQDFLDLYDPVSPLGLQEKRQIQRQPQWQTEPEALERLFADARSALVFLDDYPHRFEEMRTHLSRIPELSLHPTPITPPEFQLVKRFLLNLERMTQSASDSLKTHFSLNLTSLPLLEELRRHSQGAFPESFCFNDDESESLMTIRETLRQIDRQILNEKQTLFTHIRDLCRIDFNQIDFALLATKALNTLPIDLVDLEPYDAQHFMVKPRYPTSLLDLFTRRKQELAKETLEINLLIENLASLIEIEKPKLIEYQCVLTRLDMALAKAKMIRTLRLSEPKLRPLPNRTRSESATLPSTEAVMQPTSPLPTLPPAKTAMESARRSAPQSAMKSTLLTIEDGCLWSLQKKCEEQGVRYWPLSISFDQRANVVVGSNMGGKTVLLRTLAFLQLLAQNGFYVPAKSFEAPLFNHIFYLGTGKLRVGVENEGLSSFGFEIRDFVRAWNHRDQPLLLIIDEFARNTNSREATALLTSILGEIVKEPNVFVLISSHFAEVELPVAESRLFRMKGLAREAYENYIQSRASFREQDHLPWIQKFMQFEICIEGAPENNDAITVAEILGLPPTMIASARKALTPRH